ncbi:extracellular solute-binding protein [Modestobacter sp. VKM Ac-2977]|uniref:extracellular solute-binding protein n=1 Tax=Modestobacter sp. VKM Ac-2977 TaxID=3004131 RepID=UPI0022AA9061|nr:extracellular solute-binding protein [Modestobacter sp. VKM Ac-2977]MCZ2822649.1 extracellular solute-binding protein [Modestobacter sp. VKM Ac-2977]
MHVARARWGVVLAATSVVAVSGCSGGGTDSGAEPGNGTGEITVWAHQGQPAEVDVLQQTIDDCNASQEDVQATLQLIPEADYMRTVTTTDPDELPDVLEYDGPMMASLAYAQKLAPVGDLVSAETLENQTDSVLAQNTYPADGEVYGISQYDSSLGIYGNKALLDAAGVSYPQGLEDAWTAEEFEAALQTLAAADPDQKVLDIKENYGAEWPTFGFLPIVYSAGEQVVEDGVAQGNLNSAPVVEAVERFAGLRQYIDPNTDDKAFVDGRVPLSWVGHWVYNTYDEALGEDLVVLPLPDFGAGPKSGQGSWAWGVNPATENGAAAGALLDCLASDEAVSGMTDANAAPPGTTSVTAESELYQEGGPLELFARQLELTCGDGEPTPDCVAVPRPVTPAYPVISQQFSEAFFGAYDGGDAQELLDSAAELIDLDYQDNDNYGS